jgi:hypothetical protein
MATFLTKKPTFRRKRGRKPMVEGDVDSAEAVTLRRYAEIQSDGTTIIKSVLESLDNSPSASASGNNMAGRHEMDPPTYHDDFNDGHVPGLSRPDTPRPRRGKVSIN